MLPEYKYFISFFREDDLKAIMDISDKTKTDRLLQFILATASHEDFKDRDLGQIHLIKYLYLVDLAHAEENDGRTYTSLSWKFHHFGPWASEAYLRIEPALQAIGAIQKSIPSQYDEDFVRWSIQDDELCHRIEKEFPLVVTTSVQNYVHRFNATTEDILHFVYNTWPMLRAKPGEMLDFTLPDHVKKKVARPAIENIISAKLSVRQKKKKKHAIESLRKKFREKLENKKRTLKIRSAPPPYDDIFYEGLKTLDSLAGEDIKSMEGTVRFSDDIWKSKARFDPDVP